ncbi:O-antigen ligase family protein [Phenylobacterium sp.]|uniref:O-antigen ligase family protein n=1 Tax=Phenylobacterium sp. TaxID=1871053 RepID=UPI002F41928D
MDLQDVLYAVTTVSLISGFNHGHSSTPLFVLFVALLAVLNVRLFLTPVAPIFIVPPMIVFLVIHLASAFRSGAGDGMFFLVQAVILLTFVWLFVARYSMRPMHGYFTAAGVGLLGLLAYVAGWHVMHGFYFSWKRLSDAKAVFDVLPLILVVAARSRNAFTRSIFPLLVVVLVAAIFISGERKAYILLVVVSPLLINLRNPLTYALPFLLLVSAPIAVSLERSGYVERQIETLQGFAEGRVVKTISNEGRSAAVRVAIQTFKQHPIFGVGTNAELTYVRRYDPTVAAPHNEWLRVAAENGIIGLFFYGATVVWGLAGVLRGHVLGRSRSRSERAVAFTFAAMLLIYVSLEAFDFIVLLAFLMIPFVQYLRLDPVEAQAAPVRAPRARHAAGFRRLQGVAAAGSPRRAP